MTDTLPVLDETLARMQRESPRAFRKLCKIAKRSRGLVPVRTAGGDDKRALLAMSAAIHGKRTSGKRARKDAKAVRRAMKVELSNLLAA